MYAIEAIGLTKSFRGVRAVDGVDLRVDMGDIVALLGPNGAGKTTTLMMLLGITEPDAGSVRLLGHPLPRERSAALATSNFAASYLGVPGDMRVRQYLSVFAGLYGAPRERARELLGMLGVEHLHDRVTTQLSSGQRTLVILARALLNRPRLLILDEPTASLDPEVADRIRRVLMELQREEGFALLITSHNMSEIERLCRRVVFMARGRVVADGSPQEIARRYGHDGLEGTFLSIAEEARR